MRRWGKLLKDFITQKCDHHFDISKIPDIYDCIKYDLQHNQHIMHFEHAEEMHYLAKAMADVVIPQVMKVWHKLYYFQRSLHFSGL